MPRRIDAADTVDTATHHLHRLAAEGWVLEQLDTKIEYATVAKDPSAKAPKIPVATVVTVRLVPLRG